jgi:hypothetical protein
VLPALLAAGAILAATPGAAAAATPARPAVALHLAGAPPSGAVPRPEGLARPRLTYGLGVYLNLTGLEVKVMASALVVSGAVGCTVGARRLPPAAGGVVRALCGLLGVAHVRDVLAAVRRFWRSGRVAAAGCYQIRIVPPGRTLRAVPVAGHCRA